MAEFNNRRTCIVFFGINLQNHFVSLTSLVSIYLLIHFVIIATVSIDYSFSLPFQA